MKTAVCSLLLGFAVGITTPTMPGIDISQQSKVEIYSALF